MTWTLENTYATLPEVFFSRINPTPVAAPVLLLANGPLADALGLGADRLREPDMVRFLVGNLRGPDQPIIAQAYAGHQFGHFALLGDGRAHLLGEHMSPEGFRFDIQLKGSGPTPYSRRGDGRAALGPMLREYIISEAMFALGIPTTRSLAVIATGERVFRERAVPGAVLARVAASHIRVGTFEYAAALDHGLDAPGHPAASARDANPPDSAASGRTYVRALADYTLARHYPELMDTDPNERYFRLIEEMMGRQSQLICDWMRVGFIHGVMNTDNMTLSGETIDYGPCAFMDQYDPATVFSSIDHQGRYRFENQPRIAQWNITRLAEALLPLVAESPEAAIERATALINDFPKRFAQRWQTMMCSKLGLENSEPEDSELISDLLQWMEKSGRDYTNTFRNLSRTQGPKATPADDGTFAHWHQRWSARLLRQPRSVPESLQAMTQVNPAVIPRNHRVEDALTDAVATGDLGPLEALLDVVTRPYDTRVENSEFCQPPRPEERVHQTFCGT
jgi:uncharacterized protein YdiU (UPF0061 family)